MVERILAGLAPDEPGIFQPLLDEFVLYRVLKKLSDVEEVKREAEARAELARLAAEIGSVSAARAVIDERRAEKFPASELATMT